MLKTRAAAVIHSDITVMNPNMRRRGFPQTSDFSSLHDSSFMQLRSAAQHPGCWSGIDAWCSDLETASVTSYCALCCPHARSKKIQTHNIKGLQLTSPNKGRVHDNSLLKHFVLSDINRSQEWHILFAKLSNSRKTLNSCNESKYFPQTSQLVVKRMNYFKSITRQ